MCIAKLVDDAVNLRTFEHEYSLTIFIFVLCVCIAKLVDDAFRPFTVNFACKKTIQLLQVEEDKCDHCHMLGNVIRVTLVITRALSIVISRAKKYLVELVTK